MWLLMVVGSRLVIGTWFGSPAHNPRNTQYAIRLTCLSSIASATEDHVLRFTFQCVPDRARELQQHRLRRVLAVTELRFVGSATQSAGVGCGARQVASKVKKWGSGVMGLWSDRETPGRGRGLVEGRVQPSRLGRDQA